MNASWHDLELFLHPVKYYFCYCLFLMKTTTFITKNTYFVTKFTKYFLNFDLTSLMSNLKK